MAKKKKNEFNYILKRRKNLFHLSEFSTESENPNTDHLTIPRRVLSFKAGHFHARTQKGTNFLSSHDMYWDYKIDKRSRSIVGSNLNNKRHTIPIILIN